MATIFITRNIPESGLLKLREAGHDLEVSGKDGALTKEELLTKLRTKPYDGVLSLLTDTIDADVFDAAPSVKIFANYAVGFNNIDLDTATQRGITITNTPGVLTEAVAEHTFGLMLAIARHIPEADTFTRTGKYVGWDPKLFLGTELKGKTLGLIGAGRIGSEVARMAAHGMGMRIVYHDVQRNEALESEHGAKYEASIDGVLTEADVVSIHVPLLPTTHHLIDRTKLTRMKPTAYLINTSRGPILDEAALVDALTNNRIRGAALDVYEDEPALTTGLTELPNVVLTPHIASATNEARNAMSNIAAENLIAFFNNETPPNTVTTN